MDRRAELERKRAQLAELRAKKAQRDPSVPPSAVPSSSGSEVKHLDPEDILKQLGISRPETSSPAKRSSIVNSDGIKIAQQNETETRRVPKLTLVTLPAASIAPKESVTYDKGIQTTTSGGSGSESNDNRNMIDYYEWDDEFPVLTYDDMDDMDGEGSLASYGTPPHSIHGNRSKNARNAGVQHAKASSNTNGELPVVGMVRPALTKQDTNECDGKVCEDTIKRRKIKELSEEEKLQIILSTPFRDFFDHAVRITQRALNLSEPDDLFTNYSGYSNNIESEEKKGNKLSFNRVFCNENWSKNRTVTCLDWSDQYPELLLASYGENKASPNEPDGVCLVWNTKYKKISPEYIFHCQSPVMSACFAKFNPNLIIGGTYSGQIVLWDNRSHKKTPVQRSPLSAAAHTHPIYCIQVIGTPNAHNLISISTDGKLCSWSLDMLSVPQESIELHQKQSKPVNVTAMSFPSGDSNNFFIGSEDGVVYGASRHGNKQGVTETYEGHHAPVTRVHCNPITTPIDFSHLFLSSSFDWTVKLWSSKETKPLHSFEDNNDYVFDVRWSPIHPALFATIDITGRIDLWNLNNDSELPTASTVVEGITMLNKLIWSPSGNQIYTGDQDGKIWVYDVGEQLAHPRSDEATQFINTLTELKSNNMEVIEEVDYGFSSMTNTLSSLTSLSSVAMR